MTHTLRSGFGIMTAPSQVAYDDVLRVWREPEWEIGPTQSGASAADGQPPLDVRLAWACRR